MKPIEFSEQYGDVDLSFHSYWKYTFQFRGVAPDGIEISAWYGGNSDRIYRYDVQSDSTVKLGDVEEIWYMVQAKKDGKIIFEYNDF